VAAVYFGNKVLGLDDTFQLFVDVRMAIAVVEHLHLYHIQVYFASQLIGTFIWHV